MKVLIVKRHPPYNPILVDIKYAFEKFDWKAEITDPEPAEKLLDKIAEFKPNFLFGISLNVYLSTIAKLIKIPVVHYELDKILSTLLFDEKLYSGYDYLFTTYKQDVKNFKNVGLTNSFYLPFAYNIIRHNFTDYSFENNAAFVGSIIKKTNNEFSMLINKIKEVKSNVNDETIKNNSDSFIKLINEVLILQKDYSKINIFKLPDIINSYESSLKNILHLFGLNNLILINVLSKEAASHHRSHFLRNIPDLTVYGNKDWETLNWNNIKYKGFVNQYNDVSKVFFKSKINIDITRIYQLDGFSDRIFNVLYSNGFLMTNRTEGVLELFEDKKELVTFSNVDEMKDLLKYYLANESERIKIAETGYQKVIQSHSFYNRIDYIVKTILKNF